MTDMNTRPDRRVQMLRRRRYGEYASPNRRVETRRLADKQSSCRYPACVEDNEDERCTRWLTGECPGPK